MVMTMLSWGSIAVGLTIENLFLIVIKDLHSKLPLCRSVTKESYGEMKWKKAKYVLLRPGTHASRSFRSRNVIDDNMMLVWLWSIILAWPESKRLAKPRREGTCLNVIPTSMVCPKSRTPLGGLILNRSFLEHFTLNACRESLLFVSWKHEWRWQHWLLLGLLSDWPWSHSLDLRWRLSKRGVNRVSLTATANFIFWIDGQLEISFCHVRVIWTKAITIDALCNVYANWCYSEESTRTGRTV